MKKKGIPALLLFLLSFFLIMFFTFQNTQKSGELSTLILQYCFRFVEATGLEFIKVKQIAPFIRKLAHTAEYFLLGIASMLVFRGHPKGFLKAVVLCAVISLADQTIKGFLPGREFDWTDFPFDIAGYTAGAAIVTLFGRIGSKQEITEDRSMNGSAENIRDNETAQSRKKRI